MRMLTSLALAAVAVAGLAQIAPAQAQATRTWVSGVGDDVNPCSRTAPCKTFAGAISKTAANGEIDCLDPGGFGAVTITKSLTIDCGPFAGGILAANTPNAVIVNGAGISVILRNFSIQGVGTGTNGINYIQGAALHVENVRIMNLIGNGIRIGGPGDIFITDTKVSGAAGGGILIAPSSGSVQAALERVELARNTTFGLNVQTNGSATVDESAASRNLGNGFQTTGTGAIVINRSSVSHNSGTGLLSAAAGSIAMADVAIVGNSTGISAGVSTFGNNYNVSNGINGTPSGSVPQQ